MKKAKEKLMKAIETLADKVCDSTQSGDDLKYTQAALNAAHAIQVLEILERK